jgi:capsid protein
VKSLSIRQLFLGVYDSPTWDSLIRCKHDMSESFGSEFVEYRLRELYKHWPNVAALRPLVILMGRRAELSSALERTRIAIVEWLGIHWKAVEPFLDAVHIST